jgi:hypothetical protein
MELNYLTHLNLSYKITKCSQSIKRTNKYRKLKEIFTQGHHLKISFLKLLMMLKQWKFKDKICQLLLENLSPLSQISPWIKGYRKCNPNKIVLTKRNIWIITQKCNIKLHHMKMPIKRISGEQVANYITIYILALLLRKNLALQLLTKMN